ncbi:MAG: hypothetical protein SNF33_06875 [Candidatus Algichlamydia australiensis]|nr:hypothetical protein [Chlamydiales bacterium]
MASKREKELLNEIAEESEKTKRAREKLKKNLTNEQTKTTKEALDRKSAEIKVWIGRHAKDRTVVPGKGISLFDNNENPADPSEKISGHREQLEDLLGKETKAN